MLWLITYITYHLLPLKKCVVICSFIVPLVFLHAPKRWYKKLPISLYTNFNHSTRLYICILRNKFTSMITGCVISWRNADEMKLLSLVLREARNKKLLNISTALNKYECLRLERLKRYRLGSFAFLIRHFYRDAFFPYNGQDFYQTCIYEQHSRFLITANHWLCRCSIYSNDNHVMSSDTFLQEYIRIIQAKFISNWPSDVRLFYVYKWRTPRDV